MMVTQMRNELSRQYHLPTVIKEVLTPIQKQVNDFKVRVVADGGVFEAKACLEAQLTILSNIQ